MVRHRRCEQLPRPRMIRQADEGLRCATQFLSPHRRVRRRVQTAVQLLTMSPQIPTDCPHELRPGVTVCLHCRRAAQEASNARLTRIGIRAGGVALVLAVIAGIVTGGGGAPEQTASLAAIDTEPAPQMLDTAIAAPPSSKSGLVRTAAALPAPKPAARAPEGKRTPLPALVAPGRTEVGDGLYIERAGETVTVHFDTPETRTRRRDKFERVVRRTLPEIYGSAAEALLSSIPEGTLVEPVDLVTEVAERGVKLDAGDGWKVSLWPETRPGQDGPLVVSYRVAVTR